MVYIYRDLHMYCICGPYAKAIHMPLTHKHSQSWGRNIKPHNSKKQYAKHSSNSQQLRNPYINCFPKQYLPPAVGFNPPTSGLILVHVYHAPLYLNLTRPFAQNCLLKIGGPYFKSCPYSSHYPPQMSTLLDICQKG